MNSTKYILTKFETIRRTEKVEYTVEIPGDIKSKKEYADELVLYNNYKDYKVVGIVDSEKLNEEICNLRRVR
jgi:hypothetical protein